jgi:hypothetical protein
MAITVSLMHRDEKRRTKTRNGNRTVMIGDLARLFAGALDENLLSAESDEMTRMSTVLC